VAEINIIRGIDADRYVWPHILDQITKALPPYTWLTSVTVGGGAPIGPVTPAAATDSAGAPAVRVWVTGSTVDIQAYTTFLRQLAASPWFTDVSPATSSTVIEADRPVTAFNLSFKYKIADSVYIRTVNMTPLVR
jgi:Tfp pilus assembly protein PilN